MTEPQVWTLIGVFAAIMAAFATVVIAMQANQNRHFTTAVERLNTNLNTTIELTAAATVAQLHSEIGELRSELRGQIQLLDKDVQAISQRVFGDDSR